MTELIDNPPPLPEPTYGLFSVKKLYTADQCRQIEAAAFARGVATNQALLDRIDRLEAENEAQRKLLERAHTILELVEPNHCVTEAITQHLKGTP